MMEWSFYSQKKYRDPFNEVEFSVAFKGPGGDEKIVPGFWSGENRSETSDSGLNGKTGRFEITPYEGKNPLFVHGPIKVSADRRHFEHLDGTPFFWLGDFWTMGMVKQLTWPEVFQTLTADRVSKGFSTILVVAGLLPDMPPFDERGANEAGFPWEKDFERINPAYFDMADLRINWLAHSGLVPCIFACWGFFLSWMGVEKMKQHWRYLIARYGAYPSIWGLAGEAMMPYYLSENPEKDSAFQRKGWTQIARYVREIDPYHHPITIHPRHGGPRETIDCGHNQVEDASVLDFDMLQTGHGDTASVPNTVERVVECYEHTPRMPVINGEVCFEGHCGANWQNVQRFMFWACVLSGAAGHTYGANGLEHVNTPENPYGVTPQGTGWSILSWQEGYQLPGGRQVGLGKKLLERYEWWRMEPHPEWVEPHWNRDEYFFPYAAGIPGELRIIYTANPECVIKHLERDVSYRASWFNPMSGEDFPIGVIRGDDNGDWKSPPMLIYQDWILVLERA